MCGTSVVHFVVQKNALKRRKIASVGLWDIYRTYTPLFLSEYMYST